MENQIIDKNTLQKCKSVKLEGKITMGTEDMLTSLGFSPDAFPYQVQTATFSFFSKTIIGIGVKNNAGGVEFYSTDIEEPITINKKSITTLPYRQNRKSKNCCIFYSFLDYLAYLTFAYEKMYRLSKIPSSCDCIVLGDVSNFLTGMIETEFYDNVFCFFPNTELGQSMALTMQQRYGSMVIDLSVLYRDFDSIYKCLNFNNKLNNKEKCFG